MKNEVKLEKSNVLPYWELGKDGRDFTVAILDAVPYINSTMDPEIYSAPLGQANGNSHATAVAQVIHEVAPKAKIVMLPFLNGQKQESIDWIKNNHVDIINVSLKLGDSQYMDQLKELNIPIIAAGGNDGTDRTRLAVPARYDWTIGVGGYSEPANMVYANNTCGEEMDCVCYTYINVEMKPGYVIPFDGTSMASPWCVGMLCCYYTGRKIPNVYTIREFIKNNCIDITHDEMTHVGKDTRSGWGLFTLPDPSTIKEEEEVEIEAPTVKDDEPSTINIILEIGSNIATVNGEDITMDIMPVVKDNRTLVPIRFIAENLGSVVDYNTGVITITKDDTKIILTIGKNVATVNGKDITMDIMPFVQDGRTLVPLRFIAEALGCIVGYNSGIIIITKE